MTVLLTRVWSIGLGLGVAAMLAVILLVSHGRSRAFPAGEERVVRAVADAALIALRAELEGAAVRDAAHVRDDEDVRIALAAEARLVADGRARPARLAEVAERLRLRTSSDLTLSVVELDGEVLAANGVDEQRVAQVFEHAPFHKLAADEQTISSVILDGKPFFAFVSEGGEQETRLVALAPVPMQAGSLLRRAIGTQHPVALVREGEVLASFNLGTATEQHFTQLLVRHLDDVPDEGASQSFAIGNDEHTRLGALGRLPGAAGRGDSGAFLLVLSDHSLAAVHGGITDLLALGWTAGLPLESLFVVFAVGLTLATLGWFLPRFEITSPAGRLIAELHRVIEARQHQIFHERYTGVVGRVAEASAALLEMLRPPLTSRYTSVSAPIPIDESLSLPIPLDLRESTRRAATPTSPGQPLPTSKAATPRSDLTAKQPAVVTAPPQPPPSPPRPPPSPRPKTSRASAPHEPERAGPPQVEANLGRELFELLPSEAPRAPGAPANPAAFPSTLTEPRRPTPSSLLPPVVTPPRATLASGAAKAPHPGPYPGTSQARENQWRELYDDFLQVKSDCGESLQGITYEKFVQRVERNAAALRADRPGLADVRFAVYVKNGKAAIKAKIAREIS